MIGILCEKPSAARNFAKALGGMSGSFDGKQYTIVNARGHLFEFAKPSEQVSEANQAQYKSWDLANLPWNEQDFAWRWERKADVGKELKNIKDTLSKCDTVACATDLDPSGEGGGIFWEIIHELKIKPKNICRIEFVDESVPSIQKAFKTMRPMLPMAQDPEFRKYFYRSRWDFLSMQWTRIATKTGDGKSLLRQGRLKSAMVLLVGDALKAVSEYKKIPFYQNRFKDENGVVYTNPEEPTFKKKEDVPQQYTSSPVTLDSKAMKQTTPPRFLDLAGVSARLAAKGFKADEVLKTYQSLYEDQILSYPRTEDTTVTPEQFNDMLPLVDKIAALIGVDPGILTHRKPRSTHVKPKGAHGANRPGPHVPASLNSLTKYGACAPLLYETLARSYLACLAEDYEYEAQKGHVEKYPKFVGTASIPKKAGWKAVFNDADFDAEDANEKGLGKQAEPFVHEGFPLKPPQPTMKWLMKQLEKRDVGTGATRTSTYAEVTRAKDPKALLSETKGKISMTQCGEMSYRLLPGTYIGDLKITEQVQAQMRDVAEGKANAEELLHGVQDMILADMKTMQANGETMRKQMGISMSESGEMRKEKAEGVWQGEKIAFNRVWSGHRFSDSEVAALLAGEYVSFSAVSAKTGKKYNVTGSLHKQEYKGKEFIGFKAGDIQFEDDGICKCPKCGQPVVEWPDNFACKTRGCLYIQKKNKFLSALGCKKKSFTAKDVTALCQGKSVPLTGCVSKKSGKKYDAELVLDATGDRPNFSMQFLDKK